MIQIKFEDETSLDIYDTEHKILEKTNGLLWNATEEEPISVDKKRYYNGDYVESNVPIEEKVPEEEILEEGEENE